MARGQVRARSGGGSSALIHSPGAFRKYMGSSGRWATERFSEAMRMGREMDASCLRTLDTLQRDEWIQFDAAVVEEGAIRLRGVADLIARGLTTPIANSLGTTLFGYEKISDMEDAEVSLDGMAETENDRVEFDPAFIPVTITHKDFWINLRTLSASRKRGESLDTTQARVASRKVNEKIEYMLFNGGPTFAGNHIYGYTTHPDRNTINFESTGDSWDNPSKTGEQILADVLSMIAALEADQFFGPYGLYIPSGFSGALEKDFKSGSDKSVRTRLLEVDRLESIVIADQMPADEAVMVQLTSDVVTLGQGERLQVVQWDTHGGFKVNFKVFAIEVPLIRSTSEGRSGVVHATVA